MKHNLQVETIGRFYKMTWFDEDENYREGWFCNDCGDLVDNPHRPDCYCER